MADAIRVSAPVSDTDKTLTFETGKLALQSQGAVTVSIGRSTVLVTANAASGVREGMDFFPLTVDVEERAYAAGKIPGSFFRREGRPSEDAVLTCRLTDRPLRPSFAKGFRNETQVVITVLAADQENPHDIISINGASAVADAQRHPLRRSDRRRALGLQPGGHLDPLPDLRGGRRQHLRAGRGRARARQRRRGHHDGRGRRQREGLRLLRGWGPQGLGADASPKDSRPARSGSRSRSPSSASWWPRWSSATGRSRS